MPDASTCSRRRLSHSLWTSLAMSALVSCGGGSGGDAPPPPPPATPLALLAGTTEGPGTQDGLSTAAKISTESGGMALAPNGDVLITDPGNQTIRRLAPTGQLSTWAGGGPTRSDASSEGPRYLDASGTAARFNVPQAVAVDAAGNAYVADAGNHLVRKIDAAGNVTTLAGKVGVCGNADGTGTAATLCSPTSIAVDREGNVFVSEWAPTLQDISLTPTGNPIRKITPAGVVTTVIFRASQYATPGFGSYNPDRLYPVNLATDSAGTLYAADPNDHVVRKYAPNGQATVLSGTVTLNNAGYVDGAASAAKFGALQAIAIDRSNRVFVLDRYEGTPVREIAADGSVTTVRRADNCSFGPNMLPQPFCAGKHLAVDAEGRILITENGPSDAYRTYAVVYRTPRAGAPDLQVGTASLAGHTDGRGSAARFDSPGALAVDKAGTLYVRDRNNAALRTVTSDGTVATLGRAKNPCAQMTGPINDVAFCGSAPLSIDGAGNIYSFDFKRILKTTPAGNVTVHADLSAQLDAIPGFLLQGLTGMVTDIGGTVYAVSLQGVVFKVTPAGAVSVFAGNPNARGHADGPAASAQFSALGQMTIDAEGNVYVVDGRYHNITGIGPTVRKITPAGVVSTIAGRPDLPPALVDGPVASAQLTVDTGAAISDSHAWLAADASGNVYVTDPRNRVVRKIGADGQVSTLVGQRWNKGFAAGPLPGFIDEPTGIAVNGSTLYLSTSNALAAVKLP
ncbi:hypothetical protein IB236_18355 [Acidovorax sp. ACV02]|uniref:hypothetical protein n=1 Tax=Acidovorax sp. ACV02 TaxID=2769310 RepID=UPI00177AEAF1|nr:hypothetical protein [Acidovorax sp. ACV02]MBD9407308.1 hypothetical protein [Acidovorax sp. ACV02]